MTKAAAVLLFLAASTFAFATDWPCTEAKAAMGATINELHPEDGEQVFLVSDSFLFIAAACPNEFFAQMAANPDAFNHFVTELERLSGSAGDEKKGKELEAFLAQLQRRLRALHLKDEKENEMRLRLLKEVSTMCVRIVDHDEPAHPCRRK